MRTDIFGKAALDGLAQARSILEERGNQYEDSWGDQNMVTLFTKTILGRKRYAIVPERLATARQRLLLLAAQIDIKLSRLIGPWRSDTAIDLVNYLAVFATLRESFERELSEANATHTQAQNGSSEMSPDAPDSPRGTCDSY